VSCSAVVMLPNIVRSSDLKSLAAGALQSSILPPLNVPAARAAVQAPSVISSCDGITLYGTGSDGHAGRALSYSWELAGVDGASEPSIVTAIMSGVAQLVRNRPRLDVPSSILPAGLNYSFVLTVANWLGSTSSQTVWVWY